MTSKELVENLEIFFKQPAINKSGFLKECGCYIQLYNTIKSKGIDIPEKYHYRLENGLYRYGFLVKPPKIETDVLQKAESTYNSITCSVPMNEIGGIEKDWIIKCISKSLQEFKTLKQ